MKKKKFNKKLLRVSYAHALFGDAERQAMQKILSTPMIVAGPYVKEFEKKISSLFAKKYGVMTNSGSSANLIAFELMNLPQGSEVITPILTFGTTVAPIVQKGCTPVFVDVEPGTYQINVGQIERAITKKTRALMIPSLIGNIPDYPRLQRLAKKHHLYLMEDSCDTLGATLHGKSTGIYSDFSTTSFYGSHIITAAGSGGMLSLNDRSLYERAKTLVGWGRSSAKNETEDLSKRFNIRVYGVPYDTKFIFEEIGYNFQSTDISAIFGLTQLRRLKEFTQTRKRNFRSLLNFFRRYEEFFILPKQNPNAETAWLAFPLTIRKEAPFPRIDLVKFLEENNIQTRPIFTGNILRQPAFRSIQRKEFSSGYPVADSIMQNSFLIGCHHGLTPRHIAYLQEVFTHFLRRWGR